MIYIQQNTSLGRSIPYSNKYYPKATVATGGCGCCSSLMVLLNSTSYKKSLRAWARYLKKNKAREYSGTDMTVVGKLLRDKYGFEYSHTDSISELKKHIKAGYKAVAHVGGRGYFSSSGHFVCVAGITEDGKAIVLDPMYKSNKWYITVKGVNRQKYFKYYSSSHEVVCDFSVLAADAKGFKYYLFKPTKKVALKYSKNDKNYKEPEKSIPEKTPTTPKSKSYKKWTGYTTADTLNVRKGASTSSKVIGTLAKGTKVTIEGKSGEFYKITFKGQVAFISMAYVTKKKPYTAWTGTVSTKSMVLRVRSAPNTKAGIIGYLNSDAKTQIVGEDGSFYITPYKDKTGYVAKKYIRK